MTVQNHNCDELWKEVRKGSRIAFENLYNEMIIPLSEYAFRMLKDEEAVKDILQDLFVNIYLRRKEIADNVNIRSYLFKAVKYQIGHEIRSRGRSNVQLFGFDEISQFPSVEHDESEKEATSTELSQNISTLPVKCRKAFILNYIHELPYKQIASEMNISIKTVEKHISKALRVLRNGRWTNYG